MTGAPDQPNSGRIKVVEWRPHRQNTLRGFASVRIEPIGLIVRDVTVHRAGEHVYALMPGKPQLDTDGKVLVDEHGKRKYVPVVEVPDSEVRARLSAAIVRAIEREHGDDLTGAPRSFAPTRSATSCGCAPHMPQGLAASSTRCRRAAAKTIVFAHVIEGAVRKRRRTAILVHRRELARQASAKLDWAGVAHGIVAAGLDRDHDAPALVLSVQTAIRRLDRLPRFEFVVADEAHHARADIWARLLAAWPDAKLLGVTATPARTDGKGLGIAGGGIFDALVIGAIVAELQTESWLAKTRCFVPARLIDTSGLRTRLGDWEAAALAERARAVTGDAVAEYRKHADHQPAIAYGCTVRHAETIAEAFRAARYRAECVHGGMSAFERDLAIAGLGSGEIEVLSSCDLISEGLDVPNVGPVILLRPTQSMILAMQQIGRGMRPARGKPHLVALDHAGNVLRHGLPETPRQWALDGVPPKPRDEVCTPGWRCEACGCLNGLDAMECEECGAPRPLPRRRAPDVVEGRLTEIGADYFAQITRLSYRQFLARPRTRRELEAYARHHGYRPGWVWHRLQEQQAEHQG